MTCFLLYSYLVFVIVVVVFFLGGCDDKKEVPCTTKILREFYFADWRFFVVCGNKFLRFEMTEISVWELIFAFLCSNSRAYLASADRFLSVHGEKPSKRQS